MPLNEQFFEDEGTVTLFASTLNEVCIKVEPGLSQGEYAAFTPKNARSIAAAILAMADAVSAQP